MIRVANVGFTLENEEFEMAFVPMPHGMYEIHFVRPDGTPISVFQCSALAGVQRFKLKEVPNGVPQTT